MARCYYKKRLLGAEPPTSGDWLLTSRLYRISHLYRRPAPFPRRMLLASSGCVLCCCDVAEKTTRASIQDC